MLNGTTSEIQLRKWGLQTACLTILVSCDKKNAKTSASTKYLKKAIDSGITLSTAIAAPGSGAAVGKVAGKITGKFDNYVPRWWVEINDELSWLFTNIFNTTKYIKVKRIGITEILRIIWLFSVNKIKSSESFSKQPTQLTIKLN